ncbi:MAG: DUF6513 domain-containing protein [Planctomycetota bacterium]
MPEHLHFVTGRLAEGALRRMVQPLAEAEGFGYSIDVLPITVAALMTPQWIAKRIAAPEGTDRVIVPGYCHGDLAPIESAAGAPVVRGPRDLRRLPEFFGRRPPPTGYGKHDIQIIAEINHCPRLTLPAIVGRAKELIAAGADYVDIGCDPGGVWLGLADAVRAVKDLGVRVSVDSLNPVEIAAGVAAGAELVLSVNSFNRDAAPDWGCEVIAIPDDPKSLRGLDDTIDHLARAGVPLRIDPIVEPIGFGFAQSLCRYSDVRARYPDAEMMMGIGNLTEMTEVDSAGVNVLLLAVCQELGIRGVLTTEVIPWAQTSVRECDLARRLVYHAVNEGVPPKHLGAGLVTLRDEAVSELAAEDLADLTTAIRDHNYRLFVADGELHLLGPGLHLRSRDPFVIGQQLIAASDAERVKRLDPSHAFYLGYELSKAATALTLGKQYEQDEPLDWGYLTQQEESHYLQRRRRSMDRVDRAAGPDAVPADANSADANSANDQSADDNSAAADLPNAKLTDAGGLSIDRPATAEPSP